MIRALSKAPEGSWVVWQVNTASEEGRAGPTWTDYSAYYASQLEICLRDNRHSGIEYQPGRCTVYQVDIQRMLQENMTTHTSRAVRRFVFSESQMQAMQKAQNDADQLAQEAWQKWEDEREARERNDDWQIVQAEADP